MCIFFSSCLFRVPNEQDRVVVVQQEFQVFPVEGVELIVQYSEVFFLEAEFDRLISQWPLTPTCPDEVWERVQELSRLLGYHGFWFRDRGEVD